MILHRHHIVPKHLGGKNEESNLTPPISTSLHAALHHDLWLTLGHEQDYIAWKSLLKQITPKEARLAAAKLGQEKSELYKSTRSSAGKACIAALTQKSLSKGGKSASKKLVAWQKKNAKLHSAQCSANAKRRSGWRSIPHEFQGKQYHSAAALKKEHPMHNWKFYKLLAEGTIVRV